MDLLSKTVLHALKKKERGALKKGGEVKSKSKTSHKTTNMKCKGKK